VVYGQFVHLKINVDHAGFVVDYTPKGDWHFWIADNQEIPSKITHPYFDSVWATQFNEAKEKGTDVFATNLSFEEKNKFYQKLLQYVPGLAEGAKQFYFSCPGLAASTSLSEDVALYIENFSGIPYSDEENKILIRFGRVFQQTYTRFLDLQKAEAQAREAQVEGALERVRSRTMAMQHSDELKDAAIVLFHQVKSLGFDGGSCGFNIWHKDEKAATVWVSSPEGGLQEPFKMPHTESEVYKSAFGAMQRGDDFFIKEMSGEKLKQHFDYLLTLPGIGDVIKKLRNTHYPFPDLMIFHFAFFNQGYLSYHGHKNDPAVIDVLKRFAKVFEQTYTRFLDLQKAEAQAREATIEASLEKVRGKAMAMHTTGDISDTMGVVFTELPKLGISSLRCGVALLSKDSRNVVFYAAANALESDSLTLVGTGEMLGHPEFEKQYECWQKQENYFVTLSNEALRSYYEALAKRLSAPYTPREHQEQTEHGYYFAFSEGNFYAWSERPYPDDEIDVLDRFKTIIDLTFRRYLDLKKAEVQAREALIEAALERVRSRTLAMQKSDELAETAAVLFRQLITLGIAPNRLYIAIIKDDGGSVEFWITDEDGSKVSSAFTANLLTNQCWKRMFAGWKDGKKSLTIDMQGEELQEYFNHLNSLNVPFKGGLSQKRRVQTVAYFSKGFIGMASPYEQPGGTTLLLERFAAVFNLTLTRFNDLKLAEAQAQQAHLDLIQLQAEKKRAEKALSELSATQAQLVQQEKLASLGQLTAGIAHEIKNPLNFVNNFSSVSLEMLDEVLEEIRVSAPELNKGETSQLLGSVKANLSKIMEHGARADSIVKSMLQHSRGGARKMEQTDVNTLIKEFVNLAFHGMRASKNPINVSIELALDQSIGKVSLIAEDFSRVILNLCQNAFDAMREKLSSRNGKSYLPKLTVSSRRESNRIVIQIEDNGPGIPDAIKNKVLQPFFTTKKGTQGTGLGLSITNDIVKAHGGEMKIDTNGSGGATFTIGLPIESEA